ncbi:hypothetical protein KVH27_28000 [Streptomyces olivaceus]|uniref:DUF6257 family protein n=1 Tax=Streptomyces olivaceus TaxID=47716 RepID=UPI001CCC917A|nr:hypothetical protein [Streptomyces olivaceus]MBZ6252194.1 hypothetical protein [Streptomyces olivaceus]
MPATNHDDLTWSEIARVVAIGAKIQRRRARGQSVKALERQADRIIARAEAREKARTK